MTQPGDACESKWSFLLDPTCGRGRFVFLLVAILIFFVVNPFLEDYDRLNFFLDLFLSVILLSAIYTLGGSRKHPVIATLLAVPLLADLWLNRILRFPYLNYLGDFCGILFFAFLTGVMVMHIFRQRAVTMDLICGAVCVYFMIGFMWVFLYASIELLHPGSFTTPKGQIGPNDFAYYSFVTLTTLGYGDIQPLSSPARYLSALEALCGQLYLTILVARLVGLHISQQMHDG